MRIGDVRPISRSHLTITSEQDIPEVVELPLQPCAKVFFEKGIETFMSSANEKNGVWIELFYDTLSLANQAIADTVRKKRGGSMDLSLHSGGRPVVRFGIPPVNGVGGSYTAKWGTWLANQFEDQSTRMKLVKKTYTAHELTKLLGMEGVDLPHVRQKIFILKQAGVLTIDEHTKTIRLK